MKKYFIPAIINKKLDKSLIKKSSRELPKDIAIFYSSQYAELAKQIKKELQNNIHSFEQTLGCSKPKLSSKVRAILLISDGEFHGTSLECETNIPVYILNSGGLRKISQEQIKKMQQSKKSSLVNFLSAKKIGILISTKPGQQRLKQTLKSKKFNDKEKYFFISNNINISEFENFPQIKAWVNTACPRIDLNSNKIININDLH